VTNFNQHTVKGIKLDFSPDEPVTGFGGMAIAQRLLLRLGVTTLFKRHLPERQGYSMPEIVTSAFAGLLTGARGTFATEVVRQDPALLALMGLERAPEEATFWRSLKDVGEALDAMSRLSLAIGRRVIARSRRRAIYERGFLPLFVDGTLLEGSARREGTKRIKDKGEGLMWTVGFLGPYAVDQRLCPAGEGEQTAARGLIERIDEGILKPGRLRGDTLVLMDSLHGNDPALDVLEQRRLKYVVGANGLKRTGDVLAEQAECQWTPTPEYDEARGVCDSAVCVASVQCEEWSSKRTLVGRRWKNEGEFVWNFAGVLTNLEPGDERLGEKAASNGGFAKAVWKLYDRKGACENHFKNLLEDLRLHNPPCREWVRNAGFYAIGALTGLLAAAIDALSSPLGGGRRRIATLRRWLLCVPGRVRRHARTAHVTILGLSEEWRAWIGEKMHRVARC
jgi:hypothetical protein